MIRRHKFIWFVVFCFFFHLVLSEAALLLLLVVDSESELDRGRRGSFL